MDPVMFILFCDGKGKWRDQDQFIESLISSSLFHSILYAV